jgi:GT2 family glycosyltransferase
VNRPLVTVVIVTHNSAGLVEPVLDSLLSDPARPSQVVVVDNGSTDDTVDIVSRYDVDLIESGDNVGFAAGCHLGASAAALPVLVFLGHDTRPEHGWLPPLEAALSDDAVGAAMATIEDASQPGRFNTAGGHLTYFGLAWVSRFGERIPDQRGLVDVDFASGAAMAIRADVWARLGGFRPQFFMYHEDTDLSWRLRLAGLRLVRCPDSRVRHEYEFARHPGKLEWLERNRLLMVLSNYRRRTLWLLAPALVFVEAGVLAIATRHGWLRAKVKSWRGVWDARQMIREWRVENELIRRVDDRTMLASMDYRISSSPQMRPRRGSRLIDYVLKSYRSFALLMLRVLDFTR